MVHVHGERDGFTSAALRGASTSASVASVTWRQLPWHIINGDVAMCAVYSPALAPVRHVGSGTHALRGARATHPSRMCHAASAGKAIL